MADNQNVPAKMKFEINLIDTQSIQYSDIHFLYFIRTPIIKLASFCIIQMNLPFLTVSQLQQNISSNSYEIWDLIIYEISESTTDPTIDLIFEKPFTILSMQLQEPMNPTKTDITVRLVLVNPILHSMSTSTAFNQILTQITAYDAIKKYEEFIDTTYGKMFHRHIATTEKINKFKYEQIFIPPTVTTLNVPKYLINTYKPFHSYSIYFFDDFYFSELADKNITTHYLNFADPENTFDDFDIQEYVDFARMTKKLGKKEFTDQFRLLDRVGAFIYKTAQIGVDFIKQTFGSTPQLDTKNSETKKVENKQTKVTTSQLQQQKTKQSTRSSVIYVPDNKENAEERVNVAQELMFKKFDSICFFETENCLPYWVQFGFMYNMEVDAPDDYYYTPISIVNIFRRTEQKGQITFCTHLLKYAMLKLTLPEK